MGDLLGSLGYWVQALEVMIDSMWFISLVSIPLVHPYEHHDPMQWVLSGLFKIMINWLVVTNTHGYGSYMNDLLYAMNCVEKKENTWVGFVIG